MTKLTGEDVARIHHALKEMRSVDDTIVKMGEKLSRDPEDVGKKIREVYGRNVLSQFTNEVLGQVATIGIINGLLERRNSLASDLPSNVEVPLAPCPEQNLDFVQ